MNPTLGTSTPSLITPPSPSINNLPPDRHNGSFGTLAAAAEDDGSSSTTRRQSSRSVILDIQGQLLPSLSLGRERSRSRDRRDDPLGLTVLHTPATEQRTVDILFIHGLGGTSLQSWCRNRELEFLWPKIWLSKESDLSAARILTFGYNADFSSRRQQATINDFATDLLYNMKYASDGSSEKMGQVPIIIVAHSMGGLVFKKACEYLRKHFILACVYDSLTSKSPFSRFIFSFPTWSSSYFTLIPSSL